MKCLCLTVAFSLFLGDLMGSSVSSSWEDYKKAVIDCAENTDKFANFRQEPSLKNVYEHVTVVQGKWFEYHIVNSYRYLLNYSSEFQKNDLFGNPVRHIYRRIGRISPVTLRYVYFLGEMNELFDLDSGCKIVEVGCGYGGQCSVISRVIDFGYYELVDLSYVLPLIDKYLSTLDIQNVATKTPETCGDLKDYDLFISNYGISECYKEYQDRYIEQVIRHCSRGYILYNVQDKRSYTASEFCDQLRKFGIEPTIRKEKICTCPGNKLIYWGAASPR